MFKARGGSTVVEGSGGCTVVEGSGGNVRVAWSWAPMVAAASSRLLALYSAHTTPQDRDSGDSTATSIYAGDSPGPALTNFLLRWDLTADLYNMQHQILNIQGKRTMPVFVTENPRAYRSFINRSLTVLLE